MTQLQPIELKNFLADPNSPAALADCKTLAEQLYQTSALIVRDPRVTEKDNDSFLDQMEKYFEQSHEQKMKDVHPELSYQLGATPELTELPRDHTERIKTLSSENSAHIPNGPDIKWRYFWRIGERPEQTKFAELNAPPVIPDGFPNWGEVMDKWGYLMLQSVETVAKMLGVGLGLANPNAFYDLMQKGPHLLAPTGSDIGRFGALDTIFAGFHYDLNFLTIHGKSRFPGLFIWLRNGTKMPVKVPDGCLLLQAGKQLEWLTGGHITAGFHEVVVSQDTLAAVERRKQANESLWRVSSTLFSHIASDNTLQPLEKFATPEAVQKYPKIASGDQVTEELNQIKLGKA